MRIKKLLFVLVAFALSIACIMPLTTAFAGTSSTEIGSMNNSQWSQNIGSEDGNQSVWGNNNIKFTAETDANATNVTSQAYAKQPDAGARYYSSITANIKIESIANNAYFAFVYGFSNKNQKVGQANTFEIYFKQGGTGKVTVGIRNAGGADLASSAVDAFSYNELVDISIFIGAGDAAGKLDITINPKGNEELSIPASPAKTIEYQFPTVNGAVQYPAGRVGFGQKGGANIVTVNSVSVIKYEYLNPKNAEFTETFEPADHANNAVGYNANLLYTESQAGAISPSYLEVQKGEDGNSFLKFSNTGFAYFVTRDEYSNWAMTFDMFDIVNKRTYDSTGKLIGTPMPKMIQHFGITNVNLTGFRAHNMGAQGGAHIGWVPTGKTESGDWEIDAGKYVMLLVGGQYHYRKPGDGWTAQSPSGADLAERNLSDLDKTSMGANFNQYTGAMKVRFELIDGIYRMWFNRADTFDAFFGTEAEYIAAATNPDDPTEIVIKDFDINGDDAVNGADYALRAGVYGARYGIANDTELTADDYWAASEPYMTADIGKTPSGKIAFGCEGSPTLGDVKATATATFSVDNICVMNKDNVDTRKIKKADEIGYKVNGWPQREETHYDYNEFYNDNDLLGNKIEAGATGGITLVDLIIILVCAGIVVGVGVAAVLIILKNKPKAEVFDAEEVVEETVEVVEESVEVVEESDDSAEE